MAKQMRFLPPWGPYYEVDTDQEAAEKAKQADFIGTPPSQIYKDEGDDTIRGEGPAPSFTPNPAAYSSGPRPTDAPRTPAVNPSFADGGGGGGQRGPSFTGTMRTGGNNMAATSNVGGGIRTQFASLDPSAWGADAGSQGSTQATQYAGQAADYAGALAGVNPQVGQMDRTLYDKYQGLLMDPSSIQSSQNFGFQLDRAQEAARRQLAAGRGRHSGRALEELAGVTVGNIGAQFRDLAGVYGAGAGEERARWQGQTGAGLDASRIRAGALQGAGNLAVGAAGVGQNLAATGMNSANERARLDLERVKSGIVSPTEEYRASQAPKQVYTPGGVNYGGGGTSFSGITGGYWSQQQAPQQTYQGWLQSNWGV